MLKKTITYTDYDGMERTEDFYFNLSKAEILEMELSEVGGLHKFCQKIIDEKDNTKLIGFFKEFIMKAYGVKSPDGRKFIKNDIERENFAATEAYSDLFMELATNAEAAANFINSIVPQAMSEVDKQKLLNKVNTQMGK